MIVAYVVSMETKRNNETQTSKEVSMQDFNINFGDFSATEIQFSAVSEAAKNFFSTMFGAGAVSVNVPKSKGGDLAEFLTRKGFSIN